MKKSLMNVLATSAGALRRILPSLRLLGLVPLLAVTMASGPCGREPLGSSVDAGQLCTYKGKTYTQGARFPSVDGCNLCSCDPDGVARCTVKACSDAGVSDAGSYPKNCPDPITGQLGPCPDAGATFDAGEMCFDVGGKAIACPDGGIADGPPSEATWDGAPICLDSAGNVIPCGGDGGVGTCTYLGKIYRPGDSFSSVDKCQFCTCSAAARIECAARDCADAAVDGPGAVTGVCKPGQDALCNEDPFASTLRGKCQPDGSCLCNGAGTSGVVSPYTGKCLGPDNLTGEACEMYKTYPVGATFPCGDSSCTTCLCVSPGQLAVLDTVCKDAGAPVCGLDAVYVYGDVGGLRVSQDQVTIAPAAASPRSQATYLRTRNNVDGAPGISCNPPFPACGDAAALDVSDIMADILDPVVQKYLTSDPAQPPFLGFDLRPVDGTAFSFLRGDGHGFLVGQACGMSSSGSNCVPIPVAIDKLVKDLRALDEQQVRSSTCAALR